MQCKEKVGIVICSDRGLEVYCASKPGLAGLGPLFVPLQKEIKKLVARM